MLICKDWLKRALKRKNENECSNVDSNHICIHFHTLKRNEIKFKHGRSVKLRNQKV